MFCFVLFADDPRRPCSHHRARPAQQQAAGGAVHAAPRRSARYAEDPFGDAAAGGDGTRGSDCPCDSAAQPSWTGASNRRCDRTWAAADPWHTLVRRGICVRVLQNAAFTSNASLTSAQMGLSGKLALQPIYTMSGGQKSRVSFAMITWTKPHVMLLDEPTNHLDLVRACTFTDMRRPRTVCNP